MRGEHGWIAQAPLFKLESAAERAKKVRLHRWIADPRSGVDSDGLWTIQSIDLSAKALYLLRDFKNGGTSNMPNHEGQLLAGTALPRAPPAHHAVLGPSSVRSCPRAAGAASWRPLRPASHPRTSWDSRRTRRARPRGAGLEPLRAGRTLPLHAVAFESTPPTGLCPGLSHWKKFP